MIKLIDKKSGEEIIKFSVCIQDETYRRDFTNVNGTIVEYDKEYFSGLIACILYKLKSGKEMHWDLPYDNKHTFTERFRHSFVIELMRHCNRFDITVEMIEKSQHEDCPFLIVGESRIVNIKELVDE